MTISATAIIGNKVMSNSGESLGRIEDLMINISGGRVAYAVLDYGGVMGIGNKYFAVPISGLKLDIENECFFLNLSREYLDDARGFDKSDWPASVDPHMLEAIHDEQN